MLKIVLCAVVIATLIQAKAEAAGVDRITLNEFGDFVDSSGRLRLFHGINSVLKSFPWYDSNILSSQVLDYYKDWGFNFIRLGCMWSGVYPQPNQVNQTYIQVIQQIVDSAADRGMYTLLDMHQDVMSSKFNAYDGVPKWLLDEFPPVPDALAFPWPLKHSDSLNGTNWFANYLTYAVGSAFQDLYQNQSSAWTHWSDFWKKVAENFGNRSSVMGYELINEPWAGNIYTNPARLIPGYAGRHNLLPVYDYLVKEIRSIDPTTLIFYEPVTWGYYLSGDNYPGTGFDHIPGGNADRSRSVLSYHYYCWLLNAANPSNPYPHWEQLVCDDGLAHQVFASVLKDQLHDKMGLFLTEFGLCAPDQHNQSINTIECGVMLDLADQYLQSWSYWDSQFFSSDSTKYSPIWSRVQYFARAYPQAVAGRLVQVHFQPVSGNFSLQYELNASIAAPTEVFLPLKVHYGGTASNVRVQVNLPNVIQYAFQEANNLLILSQAAHCSEADYRQADGALIMVTVTKVPA